MTKTVLEKIKSRRRQIKKVESMKNYFDVLKARQRSLGKKTYTQAEMEARYAAK